ncbi:MAG: hypothetical protein HOJ48_13450 [Desulfobacula sp.]|jgi:hypothetical protein|nr:hypothetical protein [Desulfobacula sp.]
MSVSLRRMVPFQPDEILNGQYGDWLLLIIFCGLFIAISGAVLPRHLTEKRYGKAVVIFTGLILGIGLFKAKDIYNFNLESFGFMAIWIIILIMGFVIYGLTKMGMAKTTAISITYCIMFLSFFLLSPSLFDAISESFPLINLIFIILFFYMIGKPLFSMFNSKNPLKAARKIEHTNFTSGQDVEIEKEEGEDKVEIKDIKKKTIPGTKRELKSVSAIEKLLIDIIKAIRKKGTNLTPEDKKKISDDLKLINRNENVLKQGLFFIRSHVNAYRRHHKKDINEIQQRLNTANSLKQKQVLGEELHYQKTMLEVISFMDKAESRVIDFCKSFNSLIYQAMNRFTKNNPAEALSYLQTAKNNLAKMDSIYKKQRDLEKYLLKSDKKLIKDLKKEIKNNHKT